MKEAKKKKILNWKLDLPRQLDLSQPRYQSTWNRIIVCFGLERTFRDHQVPTSLSYGKSINLLNNTNQGKNNLTARFLFVVQFSLL